MDELVAYTEINDIVFILKTYFIGLSTYYTIFKILNVKNKCNKIEIFIATIIIAIASIIDQIIKNSANYFISIFFMIIVISGIHTIITKNKITKSLIITIISLGINYIVYCISLIISFLPYYIFDIQNDYINLLIIMAIYCVVLRLVFKIRRFKDGIIYINDKVDNEYLEVLILNISIVIVFIMTFLNNLYNINKQLIESLFLYFIIFSIIMFITIQKTLTMYYKHKMLVQDLEETKEEVKNKNKIIEEQNQEIKEFNKIRHSMVHKQKSLEYKLEQLSKQANITDEKEIKDRINRLSDEYSNNVIEVELSKTGIKEIDDMLEYKQSECIKNNINFELVINGNIHYMTNNFVPKENLEILIADHITDAIIAVNHSNNENRSILVRLGLIDGIYCLYVYDSGIEFETNTLSNLGKIPITTHADEGGTGMGFLNTFDTLRKYKGSLIIKEIGKPSKDGYTKIIMIKFDGNNSFEVQSYREEK